MHTATVIDVVGAAASRWTNGVRSTRSGLSPSGAPRIAASRDTRSRSSPSCAVTASAIASARQRSPSIGTCTAPIVSRSTSTTTSANTWSPSPVTSASPSARSIVTTFVGKRAPPPGVDRAGHRPTARWKRFDTHVVEPGERQQCEHRLAGRAGGPDQIAGGTAEVTATQRRGDVRQPLGGAVPLVVTVEVPDQTSRRRRQRPVGDALQAGVEVLTARRRLVRRERAVGLAVVEDDLGHVGDRPARRDPQPQVVVLGDAKDRVELADLGQPLPAQQHLPDRVDEQHVAEGLDRRRLVRSEHARGVARGPPPVRGDDRPPLGAPRSAPAGRPRPAPSTAARSPCAAAASGAARSAATSTSSAVGSQQVVVVEEQDELVGRVGVADAGVARRRQPRVGLLHEPTRGSSDAASRRCRPIRRWTRRRRRCARSRRTSAPGRCAASPGGGQHR